MGHRHRGHTCDVETAARQRELLGSAVVSNSAFDIVEPLMGPRQAFVNFRRKWIEADLCRTIRQAIAARDPGLLDANLAVRGKRTAEIRRDQIEPALALDPVNGAGRMISPANKRVYVSRLTQLQGKLTVKGAESELSQAAR